MISSIQPTWQLTIKLVVYALFVRNLNEACRINIDSSTVSIKKSLVHMKMDVLKITKRTFGHQIYAWIELTLHWTDKSAKSACVATYKTYYTNV